MAYNKTSNIPDNRNVKYLSKDFESFRSNLQEFAEIYFPNTYNDFSTSNPATMFIEMASYVGDILSFYTDTQIQETFLSLAQENENIYNMAYAMGYKPSLSEASSVGLSLYQLVPSKPSSNYDPDLDYALTIGQGSTFTTANGTSFYTTQECNFGVSSSLNDDPDAEIFQYDGSGNPEYWLLTKNNIPAISAEQKTQTFQIGAPERFKTLTLFDNNILSVVSCTDSDGNQWHEVDYLAQDTKFFTRANTAAVDPTMAQYRDNVTSIIDLITVPKRFVTRAKENNTLEIQFGAGTSAEADVDIIPNPDNIGLGIKDGRSKLDQAYDPSNFLYSKGYGESPSNTTLTITYLVGGGIESNVSSNTITQKGILDVRNKANLQNSLLTFVKNSIESTNPNPAAGGGDGDTPRDVREKAMAHFAAQQRAVTKEDYTLRALSMPAEFGRIAKAYITQDDQLSPNTNESNRIPNPLALNLYTLGLDNQGSLIPLNFATKQNLQTYLEQYRMLTDAINIKDAYVINIRVLFTITTYKNSNNQQVLLSCIDLISRFFNPRFWQINQPIVLSELENLIGVVSGVKTVENIEILNIAGENIGYSKYVYDILSATRNGVIYPSLDPSIFELKFPQEDIEGSVTTY